jgi:hypothetical protein
MNDIPTLPGDFSGEIGIYQTDLGSIHAQLMGHQVYISL